MGCGLVPCGDRPGDPARRLVEATEQGRVEQDVPEAVVDLLEGDVLPVERLAEEDLAGRETEAPCVRDSPDLAVTRIFGRRDALRERPRRRHADRAGCRVAEGLVGRSSLKRRRNASKRRCCAAWFDEGGRAVSRFSVRCMRSCAPFCCGLPGWMRSCEMPSRIHHVLSSHKTVDSGRGERRAVVRANRRRQTDLSKEPLEDRLRALCAHVRKSGDAQQVPAVQVDDRQRVAVHAVARAELALEVRRPHLVGFARARRAAARMVPPRATTPRLHESVAQQISSTVLRAGHTMLGCRSDSTRKSFRAPQRLALRSATIIASSSSGVRCGQLFGARLRSSIVDSPSKAKRRTSAYPVFRLMP